jgi:hypothetical protein
MPSAVSSMASALGREAGGSVGLRPHEQASKKMAFRPGIFDFDRRVGVAGGRISLLQTARFRDSLKSSYLISVPPESPETGILSCNLAAASMLSERDTGML